MFRNHYLRIDRRKALADEPGTGHNRWHPAIPPALRIESGDVVVIETRDCLDGMITEESTVEDMSRIDFGRVHPLSGPLFVEGAEPGDLLEVTILELIPQRFGYTLILPGFGLLRDYFSRPFLCKWQIEDGFARSDQLPRIRVPGAPFLGVMGVAPSADLLQTVSARENDLLARGGIVFTPSADGAVPADDPIAANGLRTIPPREFGGNIDIKQLIAGTTVLFPVFVEGALFSIGDAHFAQGDGECCGTAIEMGATVQLEFHLRKDSARTAPSGIEFYAPSAVINRRTRQSYYVTTGLPLRPDGANEGENLTLAAQNALLNMISYLGKQYNLTREQAYALASVVVDLRISEAVDVPNVLVSAFLPLDIFAP